MPKGDRWEPVISASIALAAPPGAPILLRGPLSKTIDMAADIGFTGIELHFRTVEEVDWDLLDGKLRSRALKLTSIGTGRIFTMDGLSISDEGSEGSDAAEGRLRSMIDKVERYGSDIIIGSIRGKLSEDPIRRPVAYARLVSSLRRISRYAEEKGLRVVVESINRFEADNINTTMDLLRLIEDVGSPNLLAHIDSYHMYTQGEDIMRSIRLAGEAIGHVHLADSERLAPGLGAIDFEGFVRALDDVGYKGALAFEYAPSKTGSEAKEDPTYDEQLRFGLLGIKHVIRCIESLD